jgi:thymidylate kinase
MPPAPGPPAVLAVVAEGLCLAGKTTLTRALARRTGAAVIAEYADLAPLPAFPPATPAAAREALHGFLRTEAARAQAARTAAPRRRGRRVVLLDRCPLTLIAHEHAMAAAGVPADPAAAAEWFTAAAAAGTAIAPGGYLYLAVPGDVLDRRQAGRPPLPAHLVSPATRAVITAVYEAYFTAAGPDRVLRLDATASPARLARRAAAFIAALAARPGPPPPPWSVLAALPVTGIPA